MLSVLQDSLNQKQVDYDNFIENCTALITTLGINMKSLATALNYDVSYLYRVRSKQRHLNDLESFCNDFCQYVADFHSSAEDQSKVAALLSCTTKSLEDKEDYISHLRKWLYQYSTEDTTDYIGNFLKKLDEFDLDEYIHAIHFDTLKVPTVPFQIPTSKTYYGIENMKKGSLDFFKTTVLSKSKEPIFMCSDMPMADMAQDMDFSKKWMFAIAMTLKKGLHLNIIHNIDRPFHEMMLGLESWIPIYMTGQVSPYHLPDVSTDVYHHFTYVSGAAALTGECINGHHANGKYYLTGNKEELAYYKQKAADLLSKALPLMEIFTEDTKLKYEAFCIEDSKEQGKRHNILSSLPIYTISLELLEKILERNQVPATDQNKILEFAKQQISLMESVLKNHPVLDEFNILSREEYEKHPMNLSLSGAFYEKDISYRYEEYLEHVTLTKEFAKTHSNYSIQTSSPQVFRNIQIHILEGNYVMISKVKTPVIHFVIRHPNMVSALEHFTAPVIEDSENIE